MRSRTGKIALYATLAVAVAVAAWLAFVAVGSNKTAVPASSRTVTVQRGTVSATVSATGNLAPVTSADVDFGTSGTISEVDVEAGKDVGAGVVLARLDATDAETNLAVAELNLKSAEEQLAKAEAAATTTTTTQPGQAASQSTGTSSVYTSKAAVLQARSAVDKAQAALDATTLRSPVAGRVVAVDRAVGDQVGTATSTGASTATSASTAASTSSGATGSTVSSATTPFVTIVDPNTFQVDAAFPEADAIKVAAGRPAAISVDALAGTELSGKVVRIDSTATVTSNVVTYGATISVDSPPSTLRSGMTASVTVTTQTKADVPAVQTAAIVTQGGTSYVTKLVGGRQVRTAVTVGLQGDSTSEIVSGLSAGDRVVVATGSVSSTGTTGSQSNSRQRSGTTGSISSGGAPGGPPPGAGGP